MPLLFFAQNIDLRIILSQETRILITICFHLTNNLNIITFHIHVNFRTFAFCSGSFDFSITWHPTLGKFTREYFSNSKSFWLVCYPKFKNCKEKGGFDELFDLFGNSFEFFDVFWKDSLFVELSVTLNCFEAFSILSDLVEVFPKSVKFVDHFSSPKKSSLFELAKLSVHFNSSDVLRW